MCVDLIFICFIYYYTTLVSEDLYLQFHLTTLLVDKIIYPSLTV
jgi:hypothetical protein